MAHEQSFQAPLWLSSTGASWCFVTLPEELADLIDESSPKAGFGSVRVEAAIGDTVWRTSVFPDKTRGSFILPVKRAVRETERLDVGDETTVRLKVLDETDTEVRSDH